MVTASQAREDDREENRYCVKKAGLIKIKSPLNAKAHNPPTHTLSLTCAPRLRSATLTRALAGRHHPRAARTSPAPAPRHPPAPPYLPHLCRRIDLPPGPPHPPPPPPPSSRREASLARPRQPRARASIPGTDPGTHAPSPPLTRRGAARRRFDPPLPPFPPAAGGRRGAGHHGQEQGPRRTSIPGTSTTRPRRRVGAGASGIIEVLLKLLI